MYVYNIWKIFFCRAIYTLITGKNFELAVLSKLFEGFLDDGPQFVLRLVVVVLFGIGIGQDKGESDKFIDFITLDWQNVTIFTNLAIPLIRRIFF